MIDTHVHLVSPDQARYPLQPTPLSGPWYRDAPCSAERFAQHMDEAGVSRAVLVQPVGAYTYDNRYAADSVLAMPERFAGVCCVDPEGADPPGTLEHWVRERGMRGVRLFALSRGPSWLGEPRAIALLERAAVLGARAVVTIFAHQLPELRALLERFPALSFSLDHCGFPELDGEPWREAEPLFALADLPNLHCKLTTHVLDHAAKAGSARSFVRALVDRFGAERVMWGSDFAQTHDRPYAELVRVGREAFAGLNSAEQAECLVGTAARVWGIVGGRS